MKEQLKKILPLEVNYEIKNFVQYFKGKTVSLTSSSERRIFFLDAASYNNLGDQAIAQAISEFIQNYFSEYEYIELSELNLLRNFACLKKYIRREDLICLSGGGNMGNLYPKYEAIRRKVIRNFPNNRIIVFPQTIDYGDDLYGRRELRRSAKLYGQHNKLIVCAREKKSFEQMKQLYSNVLLVPDIVLYLCKENAFVSSITKDSIGICLREDKESVLSDERARVITQMQAKYDKVRMLTTMDTSHTEINKSTRNSILKYKLDEFARCNLVVTDRLHGMIFCILTGTPCIAIDNSNKKVSGVFETICHGVKNVRLLEQGSLEMIYDLSDSMIRAEYEKNIIDPEIYKGLIAAIMEREKKA